MTAELTSKLGVSIGKDVSKKELRQVIEQEAMTFGHIYDLHQALTAEPKYAKATAVVMGKGKPAMRQYTGTAFVEWTITSAKKLTETKIKELVDGKISFYDTEQVEIETSVDTDSIEFDDDDFRRNETN